MKILNTYITKSFLITFLLSIGILTFVMLGARLVQILDLIVGGVPVQTLLMFSVYVLPIILTFTVPLATMVSVMLVFGRLSADSEITAMRACGVSILQIISPIMLFTVFMTAVCLYLQIEVGPPWLGKSRSLSRETMIDHPLAIFQPGEQIQYKDYIIYIDDKIGGNELKNVQIYVVDDAKDPSTMPLDFSASKAKLFLDEKREIISMVLYDCWIIDRRTKEETRMYNESVKFDINYGEERTQMRILPRPKYMRLTELLAKIKVDMKNNVDTLDLEVELNQRIAFALSPIAFLLLGLPMAIRTSRRETSIGLFLSVILGGAFFLLIILCESFTSSPWLYPQYLLWVPNLVYQLGGAYMIYRIARH